MATKKSKTSTSPSRKRASRASSSKAKKLATKAAKAKSQSKTSKKKTKRLTWAKNREELTLQMFQMVYESYQQGKFQRIL